MARHFTYRHLPASGLGHRDPRRPHVTGGLGAGVQVVINPWWSVDRTGYAPAFTSYQTAAAGLAPVVSVRSMAPAGRTANVGGYTTPDPAFTAADVAATLADGGYSRDGREWAADPTEYESHTRRNP